MNDNISTIETSRIVANPNNPRTRIEDVSDLVASIKENGLMQPIIVRWTKKKDKDGLPTGYEVIAGSRRLTACQQLGIKKVNCIVISCDDEKAFELATTENLVRENMTPADEARAVAKLFREGKGRIEVGAIFGKSGKWAEGRRRIANLGEKALKMLDDGKINLGHAEVLCLCEEDRVERWLEDAKWSRPEDLKRRILSSDRRLLEHAAFDTKKVCAKCEKRSDRQCDLFGDLSDSYCLDSECFQDQIKKECSRIIKEFKKAGYEAIPEDEVYRARNEYGPYIDATTDDEDDMKKIEKLRENGAKAMYWIDMETAENGLVFVNEETYESSIDDEEDDDTMTPELEDIENYEDREAIHDIADDLESEDVLSEVKKIIDNSNEDIILTIYNAFMPAEIWDEDVYKQKRTYAESMDFERNKENSRESMYMGKKVAEALAINIAKNIKYKNNNCKGAEDFWRTKFNLKQRSEYLELAKEKWKNESEVEETEDEED